MTAPLPIEILLEILSHALTTATDPLARQTSTFRFGRVSRAWYYASLAGTDTFVAKGITQIAGLATRLAGHRQPLKKLVLTLLPSTDSTCTQDEGSAAVAALHGVLAHCGELRELEITSATGITLDALATSKDSLQALTSLTFGKVKTDETLTEVSGASIVSALSGLTSLRALHLHNTVLCSDDLDASTQTSFPALQHLTLDHIDLSGSSVLTALLRVSQASLTSLDIGQQQITADNLPALEAVAPNLHHFAFGRSLSAWDAIYHTPKLFHLVSRMTNVETIDLSTTFPCPIYQLPFYLDLLYVVKMHGRLKRIDFGFIGESNAKKVLLRGFGLWRRRAAALEVGMRIVWKDKRSEKVEEKLSKIGEMATRVGIALDIAER